MTITDVAAHAGVSRATVSYVLTRPQRVSGDVRERVRASIEELGYRGNAAARQLRVGESQSIAMIVSDAANPIFSAVAQGAQKAANADGKFVLTADSAEDVDTEERYLELLEAQQVAGILIAPVAELPPLAVEIAERGTPVVHLGTEVGTPVLPFVTADDDAGGYLAMSHLIAVGRRRPLLLRGPLQQFVHRRRGALRAAGERGLTVSDIELPAATTRLAYEATLRLLDERSGDLPDSAFAGNDLIALGMLHAFLDSGIRVPQDIAVVGYDNIEFASTAIVPLTTIEHDMGAMGADAIRLLAPYAGTPPSSLYPPVLVRRQSTHVT